MDKTILTYAVYLMLSASCTGIECIPSQLTIQTTHQLRRKYKLFWQSKIVIGEDNIVYIQLLTDI